MLWYCSLPHWRYFDQLWFSIVILALALSKRRGSFVELKGGGEEHITNNYL